MTVTPKNVSEVPLTIRIAYSQLGGILHVLNDSSPFDFPQLTFSVLFQTDRVYAGLWGIQIMQILSPDSTFAQRNCRQDSQYFRADHSNGVACRQSEIGFDAMSLLKLGRQFGNFKPSPHELWGQKHTRAQRQFRTLSVESMNKSTCFSGFSQMYGRRLIKPIFKQQGKRTHKYKFTCILISRNVTPLHFREK